MAHPNAKLTPAGRLFLVTRVLIQEPFVQHYNYCRPHTACNGLPPISRVNNLYENYI